MEEYKIHVITPVKNSCDLILETIASVKGQSAQTSGRATIEYFVIDGGSNDGTLELLRNVEGINLIERSDSGMYDALSFGISQIHAPSLITCYLNSGDLWHEKALDIVIDIFEEYQEVKWLTGFRSALSPEGYIVHSSKSFFYSRRLINHGTYFQKIPPIQQESTFWRSNNNSEIDLSKLSKFKLAGDNFIWQSLSKKNRLYVVNAMLGAFRIHDNQLSSNKKGYLNEMKISRKRSLESSLLSMLIRVIYNRSRILMYLIQGSRTFTYDTESKKWVLIKEKAKARIMGKIKVLFH